MLTPLQALGLLFVGAVGIYFTGCLIRTSAEVTSNGKSVFLFFAIITGLVSFIILSFTLLCAVAPNGFAKNTETENPIVITIDKLIAGEEIPVEEMRPLLAATTYPCAELWANRKNIPKEKKEYVIETVAEAIRKATVKIELPVDFVTKITGNPREEKADEKNDPVEILEKLIAGERVLVDQVCELSKFNITLITNMWCINHEVPIEQRGEIMISIEKKLRRSLQGLEIMRGMNAEIKIFDFDYDTVTYNKLKGGE